MMTTQEIADRLVELWKEVKFEQAAEELYAENIISIEPEGVLIPQICKGLSEIKAKLTKMQSIPQTLHSIEITGPLVCGNQFSCGEILDITIQGMPRMLLHEIVTFEVKNGKIWRERFTYPVNKHGMHVGVKTA